MQHRLSQSFRRSELIVGALMGAAIVLGTGFYWQQQRANLHQLQDQINGLRKTTQANPTLQKDLLALEKDRIVLENAIHSSIVQTGGGFLLFLTAFISWKNLKATQKNVAIAADKQVAERYSQAINHLGSSSLETRFGGIHVLERIAQESLQEHWTIMQVLTSYIQARSPINSASSKIARDIQACLSVIARRRIEFDPPYNPSSSATRLNLIETHLCKAELSGANLSRALLLNSNLSGAYLTQVDFRGANLSYAVLVEASLYQANLQQTRLIGADLENADFRGAIGLTVDQIKEARNWQSAEFDPEFQAQLSK